MILFYLNLGFSIEYLSVCSSASFPLINSHPIAPINTMPKTSMINAIGLFFLDTLPPSSTINNAQFPASYSAKRFSHIPKKRS